MGDYPPQYYSPRARKYYRKRPSVAGGGSGAVGGWVELGRTTLGGISDNIAVSSLSDKRYYMVLTHVIADSTNPALAYRINGDTGSNYAYRYSGNGQTDTTGTSQTYNKLAGFGITTNSAFDVGYFANLQNKEKLGLGHLSYVGNTAAATGAPERSEWTGKWANTSDAIDEITAHNWNTGDFEIGSEVVVLGWDPADTHTNNFWEELADDTLSGTSSTLDSGTITGKKYLWIQCYITNLSTSLQPLFTFNSDTGNNYAIRYNDNGGTDGTATSTSNLGSTAAEATPQFCNIFIINNTSNEKLAICHGMGQNTATAANAPVRRESVWKWANTSNQITKITATTSTGTFGAGSILKVWGAD